MELSSHTFSVTELNSVIKSVLESSFYKINLEGELSNFRPAASGHLYFSLRDRDSMISGVMFKSSASGINFRPSDGMKVRVKGKLSLYAQRGTYQIVCTSMELFGEGDILLMLEERKRKFAAMGYFDPDIKKMIPRYPKRVAIITSPTGAAIRDVLKVMDRRCSISDIIILPSLVQGREAALNIVKQIEKANRMDNCDLILLTRGGGSIEDLLPFSEEIVVKGIFNSRLPVISGVGHEIDLSLSDLAADLRAATPSAAAEVITEGAQSLDSRIDSYRKDLITLINEKINKIKYSLSIFNKESVQRELTSILNSYTIHLDSLKREATKTIQSNLNSSRHKISSCFDLLNSLSPYSLFHRGYSWVSINNKSINNMEVKIGDTLDITYQKGKLISEVLKKDEL